MPPHLMMFRASGVTFSFILPLLPPLNLILLLHNLFCHTDTVLPHLIGVLLKLFFLVNVLTLCLRIHAYFTPPATWCTHRSSLYSSTFSFLICTWSWTFVFSYKTSCTIVTAAPTTYCEASQTCATHSCCTLFFLLPVFGFNKPEFLSWGDPTLTNPSNKIVAKSTLLPGRGLQPWTVTHLHRRRTRRRTSCQHSTCRISNSCMRNTWPLYSYLIKSIFSCDARSMSDVCTSSSIVSSSNASWKLHIHRARWLVVVSSSRTTFKQLRHAPTGV